MGFICHSLNPRMPMNAGLIEKHFERKHGVNAYYGQKKALIRLSTRKSRNPSGLRLFV